MVKEQKSKELEQKSKELESVIEKLQAQMEAKASINDINATASSAKTMVDQLLSANSALSAYLRPETPPPGPYYKYWESFKDFLDTKKHPIFQFEEPPKGPLRRFEIGFGGDARIVVNLAAEGVYVGLSVPMPKFDALFKEKDSIERDFGERLRWNPNRVAGALPKGLIFVDHQPVDLADKTKYQELHVWMFNQMERFLAVFEPRLKALIQDSDEAGS